MKKLTLSLIVATLMLIGAGMTTTANAQSTMPVYGVPDSGAGSWTTLPNSLAVRSNPHSYYGAGPDTFNFANIFGADWGGVIKVEMTDTVLQWSVGQNPMLYFGTETATVMAGGRIGSSTDRIILRVWSDYNNGAQVTFSGCADVAKQVDPGQGNQLPTYYAFLAPSATPNPDLNEFIRSNNLNSTILTVPRTATLWGAEWSVWSAIRVNINTLRGSYRDDFSITVTGLN